MIHRIAHDSPCFKVLGTSQVPCTNKPMWKPQQPRWTSIQANRSKNGRSSLLKVKVQNIKRKHHLEPLSLPWKRLAEPLNFKPLRLNVELFSETFQSLCSTCISNLYVEHFNHDVEPWSEILCGTSTRKLCVRLLSGTFMTNLFAKRFCETLMRCGTLGTWIILWNFSLEPWNLYLWNLGTCKSENLFGTLGILNLYVEPGYF